MGLCDWLHLKHEGEENVKEDGQVSGLQDCMHNDAITEREREHSRETRLFCFVSLITGERVDVQKVRKGSGCSVTGSIGRKEWKIGLEFKGERTLATQTYYFFTSRVNHKIGRDISIPPHHLKSF